MYENNHMTVFWDVPVYIYADQTEVGAKSGYIKNCWQRKKKEKAFGDEQPLGR